MDLKTVCGIADTAAPGFKRIIMKPVPMRLAFVSTRCRSHRELTEV